MLSDAIDQLQNNPAALAGTPDPARRRQRLRCAPRWPTSAPAPTASTAASSALASSKLDNTKSLSDVENVDVAAAIVDLQMQEVAYQAALGATSRVLQPTLLDFLR